MSTPIIVQASQNVADIESLFRQLQTVPASTDLLLPTHLKNWQLGGATSLIQFIVTWAKRNPHARLVTHIQDLHDASKQIERLANEDHGLVAMLMAKDTVTRDGLQSLRSLALSASKARIEQMNKGIPYFLHGPGIFFLCADHTTKAYLSVFYHQTEYSPKPLKAREDFAVLAGQYLRSTAAPARYTPQLSATIDQLSLILHELFQNTDEWAKTDHLGARIPRSVRGVRLELTARTSGAISKTVEGSKPMESYVQNEGLPFRDERQNLLEVTVFDSGPGLARRFLKREIATDEPIDEEYRAMLACLQKHATSSGAMHRGLGLHRVMLTLTGAHAFFRIRSGRLSLYRDFSQEPYTLESSPSLRDWISELPDRPTPLPQVEGTLITILLPVPIGKGQ